MSARLQRRSIELLRQLGRVRSDPSSSWSCRQGLSLRAIGRELERRGIKPRFGFPRWSAAQVRRVLIRGEETLAATPVAPPPQPPPARAVPPVAPPPKVVPAAPPAEPADIRLWIGSQAVGPHTAAQVTTMLANGRITLDTNYFRRGMSGLLREFIDDLMAEP